MSQPVVTSSALLLDRISAVRSRFVAVATASGVSRLAITLVLLLSAGMVVDWLVELPKALRGLLLLGYVALTARLLWTGVLKPLLHQPDDDTVALMVERGMPDFRSRLIVSLQLSRAAALQPGQSPALVQELLQQTETMVRPRQLGDVVSAERLANVAAFAVLLLVSGGMVLWHFSAASVPLLKRVAEDYLVARCARAAPDTGDVGAAQSGHRARRGRPHRGAGDGAAAGFRKFAHHIRAGQRRGAARVAQDAGRRQCLACGVPIFGGQRPSIFQVHRAHQ